MTFKETDMLEEILHILADYLLVKPPSYISPVTRTIFHSKHRVRYKLVISTKNVASC